jgi:hypothetical protein
MKKLLSLFALCAAICAGQVHAQSRAASSSAVRVATTGTETNPFIKTSPEITSAIKCEADYAIKLEIDKATMAPTDSAIVTATLTRTGALPEKGCNDGVFLRNQYFSDLGPHLTSEIISCTAPKLPGGKCLPPPHITWAPITFPVGSKFDATFSHTTALLNYTDTYIYKIKLSPTLGQGKNWTISKTAPVSGLSKSFKGRISIPGGSISDTNPKNNEDTIYFKESAPDLVPLKLSYKSMENTSYYQQATFRLRTEKTDIYKNIISDPTISHTLELIIKPIQNSTFKYDYSTLVFNFGSYSFNINAGAGSLSAAKTFNVFIPANLLSNTTGYLSLHTFFNTLQPSQIIPDLKVQLILKNSSPMPKILYEDIILFENGSLDVGTAYQHPPKWTWINQNMFKWDSVISFKNFGANFLGNIEDLPSGINCVDKSGTPIGVSVAEMPKFNLNPYESKKINHTFIAKILNGSNPTSCTDTLAIRYIAQSICKEQTKSSDCNVSFSDEAVSGDNPDKNSNGSPVDDNDKFTITAP